MAKRIKTEITIDEMAEILGVKSPYVQFENGYEDPYLYKSVYDSFMDDYDDDKKYEELAHEAAEKAVEKASEELWNQYCNAIAQVFEDLCEKHDLDVLTVQKKKRLNAGKVLTWDVFQVSPKKTWRKACGKILETINGVGYFHFPSVKDFLDSGPYSPKEAVMFHIGYMRRYYEVYQDGSAQGRLESAMR